MSEASAFGAVTILNATATGRGCSLAVVDGVRARWTWTTEPGIVWRQRDVDRHLADGVLNVLRGALDVPPGADAGTSAAWPPGRGLKTSSAAAAALLRAALQATPHEVAEPVLESLAVEANVAAGTTITGAYDDQVAVGRGGCHLTDNAARAVLLAVPTQPWHVAVWVPEARISKHEVKGIDPAPVRPEIAAAEALLRNGDVPGAMTANGRAFTALYAAAGLPVSPEPADAALQAGALGAGLSGTGPSVAALFESPTDLPAVAGGTWRWTRVAEAA